MLCWYVCQIKPNAEFTARDRLERQGRDSYLPLAHERVVRSGRVVTATSPLFRGYLFVNLLADDREARSQVQNTRGVLTMLPSAEAPIPIADNQVQELQQDEERGRFQWGAVEAGDDVTPVRGSLAGQVLRCVAANDRTGVIKALWHCLGADRVVTLRANEVVRVGVKGTAAR